MAATNINDDSSLIDRVYKDVQTIIKGKDTSTQNTKIEEDRKEKDEQKSKINTAQDGHNVDSDMEFKIDDILYNAFLLRELKTKAIENFGFMPEWKKYGVAIRLIFNKYFHPT